MGMYFFCPGKSLWEQSWTNDCQDGWNWQLCVWCKSGALVLKQKNPTVIYCKDYFLKDVEARKCNIWLFLGHPDLDLHYFCETPKQLQWNPEIYIHMTVCVRSEFCFSSHLNSHWKCRTTSCLQIHLSAAPRLEFIVLIPEGRMWCAAHWLNV